MTAKIAELARSETQDAWVMAINQDIWLPFMTFMVIPAVCPRLF